MKQSLYSIYDKKAQYFTKPFVSQNNATAIRIVQNTMTDKSAQDIEFVKNKEDFAIYNIGDFDDSDGSILSNVIHLSDLINLTGEQTDETQEQSNKSVQLVPEH